MVINQLFNNIGICRSIEMDLFNHGGVAFNEVEVYLHYENFGCLKSQL